MFHFIRGALTYLLPNAAVVDTGGVGYKLTVSNQTYSKIAPRAQGHEEVRLFTHLAIREEDIELFGFADEAEMDMFKLLITVSGVGPKAAMAVLSAFTPEKLILAVAAEDKKAISKANGIGPKTAARIILELHDKMVNQSMLPSSLPAETLASVPASAGGNGKMSEASEALQVLGYSRSEVLNVLHTIDVSSMEVEDIIRVALKKLMK